jgi:hypothetical protein
MGPPIRKDVSRVPADFLDPIVPRWADQPGNEGNSGTEPPFEPAVEAETTCFPGVKHEDRARRKLAVRYFDQDLSLIESEVAFVGHYLGVSQIGPAAEFNRKLIDYSQATLTRHRRRSNRRRSRYPAEDEGRNSDLISLDKFIELGIVVGNLGALNLFPMPEGMARIEDQALKIVPKFVLLGGFGEPGHMNRENVRFVFTNVIYAMKSMGMRVLSTSLVGTFRRVLNTQQSLRSILEGVEEGMRRFDVDDIELRISFVGESQGLIIQKTLKSLQDIRSFSNRLKFDPADEPEPERRPEKDTALNRNEEEDVGEAGAAQITVTSANLDEFLMTPTEEIEKNRKKRSDHTLDKRVLKYSALSSTSIIPVRRVAVQKYFADSLPKRVLTQARLHDQWQYGYLMMRCFVPEDFQRMIEDGERLTLVLDRETAQIPWEMAGFRLRSDERFFGTDLELSRQFRSVLGETNGHVPELNHVLRVLIIADPAKDKADALDFAKVEGIDIARVIADARKAYGDFDENDDDSPGRMDIRIYLRIGNRFRDGAVQDDPRLTALLADCGEDIDIDRCDPIEILKLLMTEEFDIVHYAGHGMFDPETGAMGWLIDSDCLLTAEEIFRVRRVPRMVFANACHSGRLRSQLSAEEALARQVGMAEAFFSRGIENYVGTAWSVDDEIARLLAVSFYRNALGVHRGLDSDDPHPTEILTIGAALRLARRDAVHHIGKQRSTTVITNWEEAQDDPMVIRGTTWGAYQHYGLTDARLIAPLGDRSGS